jgi:hypothetical protein
MGKLGGLKSLQAILAGYFGCTVGLPPALPGGGTTGLSPVGGVGFFMAGSTFGGQTTPPDWLSFSLKVVSDEPPAAFAQDLVSDVGVCAKAAECIASTTSTTRKIIFAIIFTRE